MERYNEKILKLWLKYYDKLDIECLKRAPLFYPKLKKNSILFIGMNPSYSKNLFNEILALTSYKNEKWGFDGFFKFDKKEVTKDKEGYVKRLTEWEKEAREKLGYFNHFKKLADGKPWSSIDVFLCRETFQKELLKAFNDPTNVELTKFKEAQCDLCFEIINEICPTMIVVANARASEQIKEKLETKDVDFKFDEDIGTYVWGSIPIFLSSMLSNGALATESRKRLDWHMRFVEKKNTRKK
ncbi:hypothetical protein KKB44_03575 [Candidatus Micrarchaeota archaeon]|nr:hypothetical protein [Candidatus Micrarchaeota archaeon]